MARNRVADVLVDRLVEAGVRRTPNIARLARRRRRSRPERVAVQIAKSAEVC